MRRTTLATILFLTLCVASTSARAGEDDGETHSIWFHDVRDLSERMPRLAEILRELVPGAEIGEPQPGAISVSGTDGTQRDLSLLLEGIRRDLAQETMEADAVLDRARANAKTLALLRDRTVTGGGAEMPVRDLLLLVLKTTEVNAIVSPDANGRLAKATAAMDFHDAPGTRCLDAIAKLGNVAWFLDGGIVRIVTPEILVPGSFHVEVTTDSVETGSEGEKVEPAEEEGLVDMVRALREEVRALRAEVREVKRILEELRAR